MCIVTGLTRYLTLGACNYTPFWCLYCAGFERSVSTVHTMKIPTAILFFLLACTLASVTKAEAGDDPMDLIKDRLNKKFSRNRYGGGEDDEVCFTRFVVAQLRCLGLSTMVANITGYASSV